MLTKSPVLSLPLQWPPKLWHKLNGLGQSAAPIESELGHLLFPMYPVDESHYPPANMILITDIRALGARSEAKAI